ncbi:uncharacterized protein [Dermacentor albipictus]|uniref:uncharacterized protein isoform X1 n=1 Tax=Dermacentor albipictus TaxID=60249 RepID=UPI0038FC7D93
MLRLCIDEPLSRSCSANFVDNDFFKDGMVLAKCVIKVSWLSKSDANLKSQYTGPPQHTSIRFPSSVNSASRKRRHAWKTWKGSTTLAGLLFPRATLSQRLRKFLNFPAACSPAWVGEGCLEGVAAGLMDTAAQQFCHCNICSKGITNDVNYIE